MTFHKGEMNSVYFKPFLFRIPSACLWGPDTFVPCHPQHWSGARWGFLVLEEMSGEGVKCRGPWRGGLTCSSLCARPFNPELHPSAVMWQWQDITKISSDCWGVWHLSLVMKCRKSTCPCCRFSHSQSSGEHFLYFCSWTQGSLKRAMLPGPKQRHILLGSTLPVENISQKEFKLRLYIFLNSLSWMIPFFIAY